MCVFTDSSRLCLTQPSYTKMQQDLALNQPDQAFNVSAWEPLLLPSAREGDHWISAITQWRPFQDKRFVTRSNTDRPDDGGFGQACRVLWRWWAGSADSCHYWCAELVMILGHSENGGPYHRCTPQWSWKGWRQFHWIAWFFWWEYWGLIKCVLSSKRPSAACSTDGREGVKRLRGCRSSGHVMGVCLPLLETLRPAAQMRTKGLIGCSSSRHVVECVYCLYYGEQEHCSPPLHMWAMHVVTRRVMRQLDVHLRQGPICNLSKGTSIIVDTCRIIKSKCIPKTLIIIFLNWWTIRMSLILAGHFFCFINWHICQLSGVAMATKTIS